MERAPIILVGVDFSPCAADGLRQAARIAKFRGARVVAVHAAQSIYMAPVPDLIVPMEIPVFIDAIEEARQEWKTFALDVEGREDIEFVVGLGGARSALLEETDLRKPELLVVGAHGVFDRERELGPVSQACIEHAAAPVLVVREGQRGAYRKVLACIDFTETSLRALDQAIQAAARDAAELQVIHVYADPWATKPVPRQATEYMDDFRAQYREAVMRRLQRFCDARSHELSAVKAELHVVESVEPGDGIVCFAAEQACDLVILGTRSHWNVRDFLWGSTAQRVVKLARTSIMAVKPVEFIQTVHAGNENPTWKQTPVQARYLCSL